MAQEKLLQKTEKGVILPNGEELQIGDLPAEVCDKLCVYGLYVKLQRATAGSEDKAEAIMKTAEALKKGKWSVGGGSKGNPLQRAILKEIKETPASIRATFIEALRTAGTLERLGITDEMLQEIEND